MNQLLRKNKNQKIVLNKVKKTNDLFLSKIKLVNVFILIRFIMLLYLFLFISGFIFKF